MKRCRFVQALVAVLTTASAAHASIIFDTSSALTVGDPTQTARLSRNGIPQDWTGSEPFPGAINTTTTYTYTTYVINVGVTPFIQIDFDSVSLNTFVSAYETAYTPDSVMSGNFGLDTNWLGDAGSSGNFFGVDPLFFQVIVPVNTNLVVVVNNTAASSVGVGDPYHLTVEGFIDSNFDDPPAVPEPGTVGLLAVGAIMLLTLHRRQRLLHRH
jgi:PEP-CTERM motif